jgi:hypothetical protein
MKRKKTTNKKSTNDLTTKPSEISMSGRESSPFIPICADDGRVVGLIIAREVPAALKAVLHPPEIRVGIAGGIVRHSIR